MTRSSTAGKRTSAGSGGDVEVMSVSPHGIWLFVNGVEYLLDYGQFPWFRNAEVGQIFDVKLLHGQHLFWPALDVDLHVESLANPARFPLVSRAKRARTVRRPALRRRK